jgi:hypothetical protein
LKGEKIKKSRAEIEAHALAKVYEIILSWPASKEQPAKEKEHGRNNERNNNQRLETDEGK